MEIIYLLIGLVVGGLIVFLLFRNKGKQAEELSKKLDEKTIELQNIFQQKASLDAENKAFINRIEEYKVAYDELQEKCSRNEEKLQYQLQITAEQKAINDSLIEKLNTQKEEIKLLHEQMKNEFQVLANNILDEKSKKFTDINEEKIGVILNPLKERIQLFEKKVEETYNNEIREKASLRKELEFIANLNKQMLDDANRLTKALKGDSKVQGDWGELQLEILLEKTGLIKDIHYRKQENFKTDDGANVRPDFIVNLPDNKNFVIDSKVSLTAYENYFNTDSEALRTRYMGEHITSLNKHIIDLGNKNYQNLYGINPPDYVFLFIPIEPALTIALQNDNRLFEKALDRNIILVSSSTLLASMRTVSFIWRQENQKRNVIEIANESGALYDKFVGFMEDLINVGKRLNNTKADYDAAMNKLVESTKKGDTIIGRMERIKKLGANTTKILPQNLLDRIEE